MYNDLKSKSCPKVRLYTHSKDKVSEVEIATAVCSRHLCTARAQHEEREKEQQYRVEYGVHHPHPKHLQHSTAQRRIAENSTAYPQHI